MIRNIINPSFLLLTMFYFLLIPNIYSQKIKYFNYPQDKFKLCYESYQSIMNTFNKYKVYSIRDKFSSQDFISAREKLDTVKQIALSYSNDSDLKAIQFFESKVFSPDDSIDGKALYITYFFNSILKGFFSITYSRYFINVDTISPPPFSGATITLPNFFVDSDIVSDTAETNGGSDFRSEPNAVITVFYELRNYTSDDLGVPDTVSLYWRVAYAKSDTLGNPYEFLIFYIRPDDGSIVSKINFSFRTFTIKEKFAVVDSLAKNYDVNSRLMYAIGIEDSVFDGKTFIASYGYLGQNNKKFSINLFFGYPSIDDTSGWFLNDFNFTTPINLRSYIDSDTLMTISELNGGSNFRESYKVLSGGFLYSQSIFDTSKILYHSIYNAIDTSTGYYKNLFNLIDPVTGTFVNSILLKTENEQPLIPLKLTLLQNYPNPFNSSTKIKYILPKASNVSLKIYDILGREVKTIFEGYQKSGEYELLFNSENITSGVYFYTLKTDYGTSSKKMILLK